MSQSVSRRSEARNLVILFTALHFVSIRASSTSITGISSRTGYTRRQVAHFNPCSSGVGATGVLQIGQTRISSSAFDTAIRFLHEMLPHFGRKRSAPGKLGRFEHQSA